MDDYREYVSGVADKADGREIIQNKTPAHAGILIAALFRKAQHQVLIVSGSLDNRAYGTDEVIGAATEFFLRPDTQLKIVLEKPVAYTDCRFLVFLRDAGHLETGRVTLHLITGGVPFHFLLADENHYRFEADTTKHEAIAQFGVSSQVELRNAFNLIWSKSKIFTPA